jgi:hypothetical protein
MMVLAHLGRSSDQEVQMPLPCFTAKSGRQRWTQTRLGQALLFLGIVWSIAGAFLLLQDGLFAIMDRAIQYGLISPDLTFNRSAPDNVALHCPKLGGGPGDEQLVTNAAVLQRARSAAYQMGKSFGLAAGKAFSDQGVQSEKIAPVLAAVGVMANALGVPAPELPSIRHMSSALSEFAADLWADHQCTAGRLAGRFTPAHAELYRFGVAVGYSAFYCINGVCGVLDTEMLRYGRDAGIPQQLWLPLARGSRSDVPGADTQEKTLRIVKDLDDYVRAGR